MLRRVLLLSAAVVAGVLAQAPSAHANEICVLTVTLEGTIDKTVHVVPCMDYDHGTICQALGTGPALQHAEAEVCLPNPLLQPGG